MTTKVITVSKEIELPEGKKTVSKTGSAVQVDFKNSESDILQLLSEDASNPVASDASDSEKERVRYRTAKAINYAFDLWSRAKLTQQLNSENADPGKAMDKAFEQFNKSRAANGKAPLTIEKFKELMAA